LGEAFCLSEDELKVASVQPLIAVCDKTLSCDQLFKPYNAIDISPL